MGHLRPTLVTGWADKVRDHYVVIGQLLLIDAQSTTFGRTTRPAQRDTALGLRQRLKIAANPGEKV
jgi:hypothetical protein